MDGQSQKPMDAERPELNLFGQATAQFLQYGANATNNLSNAFNSMTVHNWLRLVVVVGGYLLLRPLALKFITKGAVKKMEEQDEKEKAEAKAKISPNQLRGEFSDGEEDDEEEEGAASGASWGQKARVRQRVMLKQMMEAEERRKQEEEDDKDIEEFLVD